MISSIMGSVLYVQNFDKGKMLDIMTSSGIGYQVTTHHHVESNNDILLYIINSYNINGGLLKMYGYETPQERNFHQLLTNGVNGMGNSYCFNILENNLDLIIEAMDCKDKDFFKKIKGIGDKMIAKIFSYYDEKRDSFHLLLNGDIKNNEKIILVSSSEIKILGDLTGIKDKESLKSALIHCKKELANNNGVKSSLYRDAALFLKQGEFLNE